jgi:UDP-GlcNAc:undecaprenyl-phosphate GlcNAc-1-phosphate transferase
VDAGQIGLSFAVAVLAAAAATPLVSRLAHTLQIVDRPNERKVSRRDNMPLLGGLAVAAGTALGLGSALAMSGTGAIGEVGFEGFFLGSILILGLGVVDDRSGLSARPKLAVQILAALVAVAFGFRIEEFREPISGTDYLLPFWLQWTVTTLWIVAVTNAMNLMDGLDGEAAGLGCIIALTLSWICWQANQSAGVVLGVALAGALIGFLPFNFPPARIFLGDTGALFIGFALSLLSIQGYIGGHRKAAVLTFAIPMLALAVPLLDTGSSILRRLRSGRPILDADNLHLHHRLLVSEGSPRAAVLSLYFLTACFCIIAVSFARLRGFVAVAFFGAVIVLTARLLWNMGAFRGELQDGDVGPVVPPVEAPADEESEREGGRR